MTHEVVVQHLARLDILEVYGRGADNAPQTAAKWLERLQKTIESLQVDPLRCRLPKRTTALKKRFANCCSEMLEPFKGPVYPPAMVSGGKIRDVSVYGQESNPTTWRLAAMNMAIRGIDVNFGKEPSNSFTNDQHPDLRADYVMANPRVFVSRFVRHRNAGALRTQSPCPRISSAFQILLGGGGL